MFSDKIAEVMFSVGEQFELNVEQIGTLSTESGYVVLGLTPPSQFMKAIRDSLGINEAKAQAVAQEINKAVFLPLREQLRKTHEIEVNEALFQKGGAAKPQSSHILPTVQSHPTPPSPAPRARPVPPPIPPPMKKIPDTRPALPVPPPSIGPLSRPQSSKIQPQAPLVPPKNHIDLRALPKPAGASPPPSPPPIPPPMPPSPMAPPPAPTPPLPKPLPSYDGLDPYREPIE